MWPYKGFKLYVCVWLDVKMFRPVLCSVDCVGVWCPDDGHTRPKHVGQFMSNKSDLCICWYNLYWVIKIHGETHIKNVVVVSTLVHLLRALGTSDLI
jgi:hypothetical protein